MVKELDIMRMVIGNMKADDLTAIKNIIILARNSNNVKLEKKYLPLLIKYTQDEKEKITAQARLKSLNS